MDKEIYIRNRLREVTETFFDLCDILPKDRDIIETYNYMVFSFRNFCKIYSEYCDEKCKEKNN